MEASTEQSVRLFGLTAQIDLGNFAVGIATALVAFVTLIISLKASKADNRNKIAEFRQSWIDDLRRALSEFAGLINVTTSIATNHHVNSGYHTELDEKFGEIRRLETYTRLKLYKHEKLHRYITEIIHQMRARLVIYAYNGKGTMPSEMPLLSDIFVDLSQILLKKEWDRVTSEVLGRKKRRKLSDFINVIRGRKTFEQHAVEKAEEFFRTINVKP